MDKHIDEAVDLLFEECPDWRGFALLFCFRFGFGLHLWFWQVGLQQLFAFGGGELFASKPGIFAEDFGVFGGDHDTLHK